MTAAMVDRTHFERLDRDDPLAHLRRRFSLPPDIVYLDGNSLGPLPSHVPEVVADAVELQWGTDLIKSWNRHGWWSLAAEVGQRIARLIGASPDTVIGGDTTTVAIYKAAWAAARMRPGRRRLVTDTGNFPTDLYALEGVARQAGWEIVATEPGDIADFIDEDTALVALTHVDYRTGRKHDMAALTEAAHRAEALVLWDLCHSVGAMNLDLGEADLAVGCGYKYLNGGPGAPAFVYVHPRHLETVENPIQGWWGHARPFEMETAWSPGKGINRMQVGTQPILSMISLSAALDVFDGVEMTEIRAKSELLTESFIHLVDERLEGFEVVTPRDPRRRGSHVSLQHPEARRIMAALIAEGVVGDVRPPSLLRFGLAPTFVRHVDVWEAVERLRKVMEEESWRRVPAAEGPVT